MFKQLVVMMLAVQGLNVYAVLVVENFDWGPSVSGRESFVSDGLIDGIKAQSGGAVLKDTGKTPSAFSGAAGMGRGVLMMKGASCAAGFAYRVPESRW